MEVNNTRSLQNVYDRRLHGAPSDDRRHSNPPANFTNPGSDRIWLGGLDSSLAGGEARKDDVTSNANARQRNPPCF
jgi:hypothetical protein